MPRVWLPAVNVGTAAPEGLVFLLCFHGFRLEGRVPVAEGSSGKAGCPPLRSQQPRGGWPRVLGQAWEPGPGGG